MNENTISSNLTRIKDATDDIRSTLGTPGAAIEDVASDVATLSEQYNQMASDYNDLIIENNQLRQQIADITPKGTISITQNGTVNVGPYASANVNVSGGGGQDPNIKGIRFTDWIGDEDNIIKFNRDDTNISAVLAQYDTSAFTNGREMFHDCEVDSDDLINLNTRSMTNMDGIFANARPRDNTTFMANFDFTNVESIESMFEGSEYHIIDLTTLNKTINGMARICSGCHNLIACYIPNMNVTGNFHRFFQGDENLQFVDIRSMEFHTKTNDSGYIFNDVPDSCIVVVKDQVEKDWVLNYYPNLDVRTAEEYDAGDPWVPPVDPGETHQVELQVINEDTGDLAEPDLIQLLYLDQFFDDGREDTYTQEMSGVNPVVFEIENDATSVHAYFELADTDNYEIVGDEADTVDVDITEDYTIIAFTIRGVGGNE